jgi:manganese-dependent inorganic pyrophosphatase
LCRQEGYDVVILMLTDILRECSYLIYTGQAAALVEDPFGRRGQAGVLYLQGVMFRKKQIVLPMVETSRS